MITGYARVSTLDQAAGLAGQIATSRPPRREGLHRPSFQRRHPRRHGRLPPSLPAAGDVLMVTQPDRLARSTSELLAIEADLSKRKIGLVILSRGGEQLDTRNPTSKLMLTILAGVAICEREIMLGRQREGIAKAKAEGKCRGRPAEIDVAEVQRLRTTMGRGDRQAPRHCAQ